MLCGIRPRQLMIRQRIHGRPSRARCVRKLSEDANPEAPAVVPASLRYLRHVTFDPRKGNIPSCSATMLPESAIIMRVPHARFISRSPSNAHGDVLRGATTTTGGGCIQLPDTQASSVHHRGCITRHRSPAALNRICRREERVSKATALEVDVDAIKGCRGRCRAPFVWPRSLLPSGIDTRLESHLSALG